MSCINIGHLCVPPWWKRHPLESGKGSTSTLKPSASVSDNFSRRRCTTCCVLKARKCHEGLSENRHGLTKRPEIPDGVPLVIQTTMFEEWTFFAAGACKHQSNTAAERMKLISSSVLKDVLQWDQFIIFFPFITFLVSTIFKAVFAVYSVGLQLSLLGILGGEGDNSSAIFHVIFNFHITG